MNTRRLILGLALAGLLDTSAEDLTVLHYPGPGTPTTDPVHLVAHPAGGFYLGGTAQGLRYLMARYDAQGAVRWVRDYQGPGGNSYASDTLSAIALDHAGHLVITGTSLSKTGVYDFATLKLDPEGNTEWVSRYDGDQHANEHATSVAVDGADNVYVTGSSTGFGTFDDFATVKYSPDGRQLWVARYATESNWGAWDDVPAAMAVDASGNVFVTGTSTPHGSYTSTIRVVKHDTDGHRLWVSGYEAPAGASAWPTSLLPLADGGLVVLGTYSHYATGNALLMLKYDAAGAQAWAVRYQDIPGRPSTPGSMVEDAAGALYVCGTSGMPAGGLDAALLLKIGTDGRMLWSSRYTEPGRPCGATALQLDPVRQRLRIAGASFQSDTQYDMAAWEADLDGHIEAIGRFDGPMHRNDSVQTAVLDFHGSLLVGGISNSYTNSSGYDYVVLKFSTSTRIEPLAKAREGPFEFRLLGERGMAYRVDLSENLVDWMPLTVISNATGEVKVSDPGAAFAPRRFYRPVRLP